VVVYLHVVVVFELILLGVSDLLFLVCNDVLDCVDLSKVGSLGFPKGQAVCIRDGSLLPALLLFDLQGLDAVDFGFDVVLDDGSFGHADEEVLDVHDLLFGFLQGVHLADVLDDRDVAQLPPTLDFVFLLYFDQSVFQPEVQEFGVVQVALLVY